MRCFRTLKAPSAGLRVGGQRPETLSFAKPFSPSRFPKRSVLSTISRELLVDSICLLWPVNGLCWCGAGVEQLGDDAPRSRGPCETGPSSPPGIRRGAGGAGRHAIFQHLKIHSTGAAWCKPGRERAEPSRAPEACPAAPPSRAVTPSGRCFGEPNRLKWPARSSAHAHGDARTRHERQAPDQRIPSRGGLIGEVLSDIRSSGRSHRVRPESEACSATWMAKSWGSRDDASTCPTGHARRWSNTLADGQGAPSGRCCRCSTRCQCKSTNGAPRLVVHSSSLAVAVGFLW